MPKRPTPEWEQFSELWPREPLFCYYADGDTTHGNAVWLVHDARGCVATCDHCMRWRASLGRNGRREGHGETCPEVGVLA